LIKKSQKLQEQSLCYKGLSALFDEMTQFLPLLRQARELVHFKNVQSVLKEMLDLMEKVLNYVIEQNQNSMSIATCCILVSFSYSILKNILQPFYLILV